MLLSTSGTGPASGEITLGPWQGIITRTAWGFGSAHGLREARPTGLDVSPLCLGCMSYGVPSRGGHPWSLDEEASRPFIKRALELGINFFDTAERLLGRHQRGDRRPGPAGLRRPRRGRHRHQGPRPDAARSRTARGLSRKAIMTEIDAQPAPARHRLRRPLPDPSLGPRDADRGNARGAARRGQGGQGALHRRLVDVRLAVRARRCTSPSAHGWTRFVTHAEPLQPALPRGGARDAAALRGRGHRRHPLEPAGARAPDPRLGRRAPRGSGDRRVRADASTRDRGPTQIVERSPRSPQTAACPARRSRWPGCWASPA